MRGRGRATALAAAIAALLSMAAQVAPAKVAPPPHPMAAKSLFGQQVVPGEVIVRYEQGASRSERAEASEAVDANFERKLLLPRTELVEVPKGAEQEAAAQLERDPNVLYAEPNAIVREMATPNDTRFTGLWGLKNTGQQVNHVAGAADADIDATEGWSLGAGLGSSLRVAVVDSGVVANHPDLAANMFINPGENGSGQRTNGIDDDGNGKIDDFRGWDFAQNDNNPTTNRDHGTHVAGTIAARSNNNLGVAGAASFPAAGSWRGPRILAVKVLDEQGMGTVASVADGLVYAGTMNAKVANASIGFAGTSATLDDAIKSNPGTLYVVAAGNNGSNNDTNPRSPCNPATTPDAPNKLCVGATGPQRRARRLLELRRRQRGPRGARRQHPEHRPDENHLQRRLRDLDPGSLEERRRRAERQPGLEGARRCSRPARPTASPTRTGGTAADPTRYVANQDNWARNRTGFDLTGGGGCKLTAQVKVDTEDNFDWFTIEATRTPGAAASWQELFAFSGAGTGSATADLSAFDNRTGVFVRFRLDSDGSRQDDGAYVDDVAVTLPHDRLRRDLLRLPQRHLDGECAGRRRRRVPVHQASDGDRSPDQGQAPAGSRQEGLPCRRCPYGRPPQPLQGGGRVDGGRCGRRAHVHG